LLVLCGVDDQLRVVVLPRCQHFRSRQTGGVAGQRKGDDRQRRPGLVPERDLRLDRPSGCGENPRGQLVGPDRLRRSCAVDSV
jgi:hypothetical protein